ncbi:MAG: NUDIX domain-containing protein [Deltaproteobacteria bacterium]|nr:NUDIX domain-containing protein [Deltaproteobacteria bacterium]
MDSFPLTIRPGVAAVVFNAENEILLHLRKVGGGWAPPSGSMEPGETVAQALSRELLEETGLEVRIGRLVAVYSDPAFQIVHYPDGRRVHFVTTLFRCRVKRGTMKGSEEGTEWGWFPSERLPSNLLPYARVWLADALTDSPRPLVK